MDLSLSSETCSEEAKFKDKLLEFSQNIGIFDPTFLGPGM